MKRQADFPVGCGVVYTPYPGAPAEDGQVTGWSKDPSLVFVKYRGGHPSAPSQATSVTDLQRAS
jgi:hypothetical protein